MGIRQHNAAKLKRKSLCGSYFKAYTDSVIIHIHTKETGYQGPVRTMSFSRCQERTVKQYFRRNDFLRHQFPGDPADPYRTGSMGT